MRIAVGQTEGRWVVEADGPVAVKVTRFGCFVVPVPDRWAHQGRRLLPDAGEVTAMDIQALPEPRKDAEGGITPRTLVAPLLDLWRDELVTKGTKLKNAVRMRRRLATAFEEASWQAIEDVAQAAVAGHLRGLVNGTPGSTRSKTSPKTAENVRWLISLFFAWAVREGHAKFNPALGISSARTSRNQRGASSRKGMRALYDDEPMRLIAAALEDEARPERGKRGVRRKFKATRSVVYQIALMTGARKGQLTLERGKDDPDPIRWRDVDLDSGNPGITVNDTKNGDNWWLPLVPDAVVILQAWRDRCSVAGPDEYVFAYKIRDDVVNADLKAAKIPKRGGPTNRPANFHSLRKTFCTNLVLAGVELPFAQQLMQHRTLEMTVRVYTEIRREQLAAGACRVEDFFSVGKMRPDRALRGVQAVGSVTETPSPTENDLTYEGGFTDTARVTTAAPSRSDQRALRGMLAQQPASHPCRERRVGPLGLNSGGGISPTAAPLAPFAQVPEEGLEASSASTAFRAGSVGEGSPNTEVFDGSRSDRGSSLSLIGSPDLHGAAERRPPAANPVEHDRGAVPGCDEQAGDFVPVDRDAVAPEPRGGRAAGAAPSGMAGHGESGYRPAALASVIAAIPDDRLLRLLLRLTLVVVIAGVAYAARRWLSPRDDRGTQMVAPESVQP